MSILGTVLLVFFVIACILIIALVLLQNEEGDSLGGLFAGSSTSAFGSKSGNILTKTTYIMVTLFFVGVFSLALLNKSPSDDGLQKAAQKQQEETSTEWWNGDEKPADDTSSDESKGSDQN